jgi:NADP-dependent 3-hydroxy acid dehydrogenase YdfG
LLDSRRNLPIYDVRTEKKFMIDQTGKTAWITGASSGIGEALSKAFVAGGGACVLSGRNIAELEKAERKNGA